MALTVNVSNGYYTTVESEASSTEIKVASLTGKPNFPFLAVMWPAAEKPLASTSNFEVVEVTGLKTGTTLNVVRQKESSSKVTATSSYAFAALVTAGMIEALGEPIITETPEANGAARNGKFIKDAEITGGTAILKAPTSKPFVAGDVGKYIGICGCGATISGEIHNSATNKIKAYKSAEEVELEYTVPNTVKHAFAVYGTDDTAAIMKAIWKAVERAISNSTFYAQVKLNATGGIYVVAGAMIQEKIGSQFGGFAESEYTFGNAQIPLPVICAFQPWVSGTKYAPASQAAAGIAGGTYVEYQGKNYQCILSTTGHETVAPAGSGESATYWKLVSSQTTSQKVTLNLVGSEDSCALPLWYQKIPQQQGPTILSLGPVGSATGHQPANSATYGRPAVIGGPTKAQFFETGTFSNMYFKTTGVTMTALQNSTMSGIDLQGVATCAIETHAAYTLGIVGSLMTRANSPTNTETESPNIYMPVANIKAGISENSFVATAGGTLTLHACAIGMPQRGNNDLSYVGNVSIENWPVGIEAGEHAIHQDSRVVSCKFGVEFGKTEEWFHAAVFPYISIESCQYGVISYNAHASKVRFICLDVEGNSEYDIFDWEGASIRGDCHIFTKELTKHPKIGTHAAEGEAGEKKYNGLAALKVVQEEATAGLAEQPAMPGSSAEEYVNRALARDAIVTIKGGTVTKVEVAPSGSTSFSVALEGDGTVLVPSFGRIKITWAVKPEWLWTWL